MKSGLEDRNNSKVLLDLGDLPQFVSMKSGLEDRNNHFQFIHFHHPHIRLNEVRPGRPEQFADLLHAAHYSYVSMKSGLEDRNNFILRLRMAENYRSQ